MCIVLCSKCEGTGQVHYDVGTHKSEYEYEQCSVCEGSGRLIETKIAPKYEPFVQGSKSTRIF